MTRAIMAILMVLSAGLSVAADTVPASAESSLPLQGTFVGSDTDGDDYGGIFTDFGWYSAFGGMVTTEGTYEFVEDPTHDEGGYYATTYTMSDGSGNSLSFYDIEVSFLEYDQGRYGISQTEWTITGGEGKFSDATGQGKSRVWFNLEDISYRGIASGTIALPS